MNIMDIIIAIFALFVLGFLTFLTKSPIMYVVMIVASISASVVIGNDNDTEGFDLLQGAFYVVAFAYAMLFFGRAFGKRR